MKIFKTTVILTVAALFIFAACEKRTQDLSYTKPESEMLTTLNALYNVTAINENFDLESKTTNLNKSDEWNYSTTTKFDFSDSNTEVYIVPAIKENKYYAIKGNIKYGRLSIEKEAYCRVEIDESGNGFLEVLDINNNLIEYFVLNNGKPISDEISKTEQSIHTKSTKSLCQREGTEGTSECYKRETDEFCDGFIGCLTLATNPQVHALILVMCMC